MEGVPRPALRIYQNKCKTHVQTWLQRGATKNFVLNWERFDCEIARRHASFDESNGGTIGVAELLPIHAGAKYY